MASFEAAKPKKDKMKADGEDEGILVPLKSKGDSLGSSADGLDVDSLRQEVAKLRQEIVEKDQENAKLSRDKAMLEACTKKTIKLFEEKYLVSLQEVKAKLKRFVQENAKLSRDKDKLQVYIIKTLAKLKEKQDKIDALEGEKEKMRQRLDRTK